MAYRLAFGAVAGNQPKAWRKRVTFEGVLSRALTESDLRPLPTRAAELLVSLDAPPRLAATCGPCTALVPPVPGGARPLVTGAFLSRWHRRRL